MDREGGFGVKGGFDGGVCMEVGKGEGLFWVREMGWMMGGFVVFGGLMNGGWIVLYEGGGDYGDEEEVW